MAVVVRISRNGFLIATIKIRYASMLCVSLVRTKTSPIFEKYKAKFDNLVNKAYEQTLQKRVFIGFFLFSGSLC